MGILKKLGRELKTVLQIGGWGCFSTYVRQVVVNLPAIIKTRSLTPADRTMAGRRYTFKVFDRTISLDGAVFGAAREIYGRKVYFALPQFSLNPTDTVIDLGANVGVFTTLAACVASKVVAVEAQSNFLPEIYSNAKHNNCSDKVSAELAIVGVNSGVFSDAKRLTAASHFEKIPPMLSMSEIMARHQVNVINFLKVDIEGSEFDLLGHNADWLSSVEKIAMEVHLNYGNVNELAATLKSKGFAVWLVDNDQNIVDKITGASGYLFAKREDSNKS